MKKPTKKELEARIVQLEAEVASLNRRLSLSRENRPFSEKVKPSRADAIAKQWGWK